MLTSKKFWEKLSKKSKLMAEFMHEQGAYYNAGSISEDIFALYEEGARAEGVAVGKYARQIAPNKFVKMLFSTVYENSTKQERKNWHKNYIEDWDKISAWEREDLGSEAKYD